MDDGVIATITDYLSDTYSPETRSLQQEFSAHPIVQEVMNLRNQLEGRILHEALDVRNYLEKYPEFPLAYYLASLQEHPRAHKPHRLSNKQRLDLEGGLADTLRTETRRLYERSEKIMLELLSDKPRHPYSVHRFNPTIQTCRTVHARACALFYEAMDLQKQNERKTLY